MGSESPVRPTTSPIAAAPPVLIVRGTGDAGPDHWLNAWEGADRSSRRVALPFDDPPRLDGWAAAIARAIDACDAPPVIVTEGFGCLATLRAGYYFERPLGGTLLVAPVDPARAGVARKLPVRPLPYPAILVARSHDPELKLLTAATLALRWGCRFVALHGSDDIDDAPGRGRWRQGLRLVEELRARAGLRGGADGADDAAVARGGPPTGVASGR